MIKNTLIGLGALLASVSVDASPAFLKEKIVNNTPYDVYFGIRSIFTIPGDECFGVIPAHSEKNCNLNFDNQYPFFYLYLIRAEQPGQEDLSGTLKLPMLRSALSANMELTISYDEAKQEYGLRYSLKDFVTNQTISKEILKTDLKHMN